MAEKVRPIVAFAAAQQALVGYQSECEGSTRQCHSEACRKARFDLGTPHPWGLALNPPLIFAA